jgi:3-phenylpropionate/trans-cinnamate dioxygenase ferredoxin reductase component
MTGSVDVEFLIVGGGMTGDAAVRGIRSLRPDAGICLISDEPHPPYDRPPLSKGLWSGGDEEGIWRDTESLDAEIRTGVRIVHLDPSAREVRDSEGRRYRYGSLLLATGSRPRTLAGPSPGVVYFRTLDDFRTLRERVESGGAAGIVGGGFIGCELAASMAGQGLEIHQFFPESRPLERVLPPLFSELLARKLEALGVRLRAGKGVRSATQSSQGLHLLNEAGERSGPFPAVAAGLGVDPRDELASRAGLDTRDGILVDRSLRTSDPHIWAAGDVARFPLGLADAPQVVAHEEHANQSGMLAGQGMAGDGVEYDPLPYVYSGIGSINIEMVGLPVPSDRWEVRPPDDPEGPGVARALRGPHLTGVCIWNRPGRAHRVRRRFPKVGDAASQRSELSLDALAELVLE